MTLGHVFKVCPKEEGMSVVLLDSGWVIFYIQMVRSIQWNIVCGGARVGHM